jgi:hypothetical protein
MNKIPDFTRTGEQLRRAADKGLAQGAATLANALRARGLGAEVQSGGDGSARVVIEGTGLMAREFGTLTREAQPVVAPVVRAHAQEIVRLIAAEISASSSEAIGQKKSASSSEAIGQKRKNAP